MKPENYDKMTAGEKWSVYQAMLKSGRGGYLMREARTIAGKDFEKAAQVFIDKGLSDRVNKFGLALVTREALKVAIGSLTMKDHPDWSNIQDMEILIDGLTVFYGPDPQENEDED